MAPQVMAETSPAAVATPTFTPALQPPPGVTSNPRDPASLVGHADIAIGICLPLVTIFFFLRTYARLFLKRVWLFEDALVTMAWAGTVAYCGIMRATMAHHGGQHGWDITKAEAHEASYWFNVAAIEYGVMIGVTKCAVLCLYRRVFSTVPWSKFDLTIVTLIFLMVGFYGGTSIVKIFECYPRDKIWNNTIPGKCVNITWILNVSGCFNTVTDFLILLLPVHAVWKLQIDRTKRAFVILVFTFGLCAPAFATVGFVVRLQNSGNPDTSWAQPEILLWGAAELASGNLCVCFPELFVLLRKPKAERPPSCSTSKEWNKRGAKPLSHPYFTKSLFSSGLGTTAVGSKNDADGQYIELQDQGHDLHVVRVCPFAREEMPKEGVIIPHAQNEVLIEGQKRSG